MPKCILHVGMHKTGTSSLQASLQDLADRHFYYARLQDNPNHGVSLYSAFARPPKDDADCRAIARYKSIKSGAAAAARCDLIASIEAANGRTLVLSGEGMSLMSRPELGALQAFLTRHAYDQFEIIGYLRPPGAFMSSIIQQHIKSGMKGFKIRAGFPQYRKRFAKFDRLFGKHNVKLYKFDPLAFPGNDVVLDFCARTGIPEASISLSKTNESISRTVAQLLYQYAKNAEACGLPPMKGAFARKISVALQDLDKTKFRLSPKLALQTLEEDGEDIAWMENRLGQPLSDDLGE